MSVLQWLIEVPLVMGGAVALILALQARVQRDIDAERGE
jgi:hypothetical protein